MLTERETNRRAASPFFSSTFVGPLRAIKKLSEKKWLGCLPLSSAKEKIFHLAKEAGRGKETNKLNSTSSIHLREWSGMSLVSFPLINSMRRSLL